MTNYFEIEKPLRQAIAKVGTVGLANNTNKVSLFQAFEMVGIATKPFAPENVNLYRQAVAIATASVLS